MDHNGYSAQNGGANGRNDNPVLREQFPIRTRPYTVSEAIPYSPFSSIVPFNSDIIPMPHIGLRSSTSIFANETEKEAARQSLDNLNREATSGQPTSQRLQQTLEQLQNLLKPDGLSIYKFKTAPKPTSGSQTPVHAQDKLGPLARMVYDTANVEFRYPSPVTPSSKETEPQAASTKHKERIKKDTHLPSPKATQYKTINEKARDANAIVVAKSPNLNSSTQHSNAPKQSPPKSKSSFEIVIPSRKQNTPPTPATQSSTLQTPPTSINPALLVASRPSTTPTIPSDTRFAVVIDNHPRTFKPEDYEVVPEASEVPDDITHLSKKRSRTEYEADGVELTRGLDQREKADLAFRNLREYLLDIFEAEDQFQPGAISLSNEFFVTTDDGLTMSGPVQTKVETLLQKMISVGHFSQAPLDDLLRVQRLCDGALKVAETVDIRIEPSMGESDFEPWLQQLSKAELGLRAAKTALRIMAGGREEKQLYSEDVIQSAIQVFKNVMDSCIIPVVEMRSSGSSADLFKLLSSEKKTLLTVLSQCRRLLSLMAILVASIELSETVMNTLEFTTSQLIFVENAHFERESVLGIAKFDVLRVVAMDVLAEIFRSSPSQRQGIFDEILTSLEKLPVTRQSARQFKLAEGGSIQLVSALIMRLIQTSASKSDDTKNRRNKALGLEDEEADESHPQVHAVSPSGSSGINTETRAAQQNVTAVHELIAVVSPLLDNAKANASYVVAFIVGRAMTSTKTGDAPYRNLLDLFIEDFIKCLNYTDWPAAELLLRLFLFKMVQLAEGDKTATPAKNMALEVLGLMGAAISELNSHVRKTAGSFENSEGELGKYLAQLADSALERRPNIDQLVSWTGPFRASLESLEERSTSDSHVRSAIGLLVAEWASIICSGYDLISDDNPDQEQISHEYGRLAYRLRMMILDKKWLSTEYNFDSVSPTQARLAYSITLLHSQFCQSFGRVLTILLGSMASEQATVRSKSLKSVIQLLETDPTILDTELAVTHLILRCANDPSVQVRDSALGLIGKCISLRPALEQEMIPSILQRVNDSGANVRKRAMKLSKDIYFRNTNKDIRSSIADALLHRVADIDEGVQELARQTIEEVWMSPFYQATSSNDTSAQFKLAMAEQVTLMVKTVQRPGVSAVLDKILQSILSDGSKNASANFKVCTALVASMFDTIIDNPADNGGNGPSARDALQVLTVFAKSNAKLFTPEQIQLLQPYVANVGSGDDLTIYRSVVIIFRHVLPHLSKMHHNFLISVRKELIPAVSKMGKTILDDLVACLWIISSVLDDFQHLTRLVLSSLNGVQQIRNANLNDPSRADIVRKLNKLLLITGMCGKHCDLDAQSESFKKAFPKWKGTSVSTLMCDTFAPFASPSQPIEVRKAALDAIGMVCQSWPKNFSSVNIYTSFLEAFGEQNKDLEVIIMRSFKEFLNLEEKRSEAGNDTSVGTAGDPVAKLGVMGGSQHDGVAIAIAQRFLKHITRIALASQDDQALLATEILGSINRQGLVHPKECGPTLIALETSQNAKIAEIAFREHKSLHEKHETILEKEYMRAIQLAYTYQRDVTKNTHGATVNPFTSKLHMMIEVMKISKVKNRKKFFESLCTRIDFDPTKMNVQDLPHHLEFSQFIIENLAFFDYVTVDELLSTISSMEKVVAGTGTSIAHAIETEIFQIKLHGSSQADVNMEPQVVAVDPIRLRLLTASSMMLSSLWDARTYLRRQYGLTTNRKDPKAKTTPKDLNRVPLKIPSITGEKFWEDISTTMGSLATEESMMSQCRAFVELLNIDQDFKVSAEADDEAGPGRPVTPTEPNESFVYHQQNIAGSEESPMPLPPLPMPTNPAELSKKALLMSLFMDPSRTDFSSHEVFRTLSPQDLDMPIDPSAHTALHWASTLARLSLVKTLIAHGASIFRVNRGGETALMRACVVTNNLDVGGFPDLLELLGPTIELRDSRGRTVLHHIAITSAVKGRSQASKYYLESLLEFVVRKGSAPSSQQSLQDGPQGYRSMGIGRFISEIVNLQDKSGDTALNIAARIGNRSIISQLIEVGADPSISNRSHLCPMDFGIGDPSNVDNRITGGYGSSGKNQNKDERESSGDIISSITTLLTETETEFSREMESKQEMIDSIHSKLREASAQLGEERRRLDSLLERSKGLEERKLKISNLKRAIEEEKLQLSNLQQQQSISNGTPMNLGDADQLLALPAAIPTNILSSISLSSQQQPVVLDQAHRHLLASLPSPAVLRARASAYKVNNAALKDKVQALESESTELAAKYRKIISLCTRVEEASIDDVLENLLRAVESETNDVELSRVREFLARVEGGE